MSGARSSCESQRAHLAFIETGEEQAFLETVVEGMEPDGEYWIGLEKNKDGVLVWMNGATVGYEIFGDPSYSMNDGGECFRLTTSPVIPVAGSYQWYDEPCDEQHQYICEKRAGISNWHIIFSLNALIQI